MKIVVSHATKEIHGIKVLKDVSMALESGSVYGFLGRNGSGKTMMMQALCGFISLTEGSIEMDGSRLGSGEDFPRNLGMLLETPVFLPERTGYENLRLLAAIRERPPGMTFEKHWSRWDWTTGIDGRWESIPWECASVWELPAPLWKGRNF